MPEIGVEIQAIDNTGRGIKNAEKSMGRLKGAVRGVTSAAKLAAFGIGGIAIAGAGIGIALATQFIGAGKEMQRFSNRTGHSVEQLSAMGYAAERVGLELEDMIDVTEEMRIKAFDAAEGSEAMAAHFAELGINVQEFLALDADEQFNLTAEALGNVEDATRRTILADELLSDTGKRLLEVTQSNADGFAGLAAQAAAAGRIMSTDTVSSITRMNSAFVKLKDRGLGLALGLFKSVAPVLADAAESVLGFADVLQEDGLAGAGDVAWKAMGRLSESLGTESGLGKFVAAAHEEFGNFVEYLWNSDSVFEAVDEYFNISETVDKFTGAIDKAKGGLDGWLEKLGIVKEPADDAKDTIEALNTQIVRLGDGSMTYTDNPVLSGLKGDTDGLVVPITTYKEALEALNTAPQYTGNPVIEGLQGDIAEIAATLDPGLKDILQGFSAEDSALTSDLQEIADTIPLISQAFTDETPAITAAISGYTVGFGNLDTAAEEVKTFRGDTNRHIGAVVSRLGLAGAPVALAWAVISGSFETGRIDSVAEVAGLNDDVRYHQTPGTLSSINFLAAVAKIGWQTVRARYGLGRTESVAEVTGLATDTKTAGGDVDTELGAFPTLFGLQWGLIQEVFNVGRKDSVAEVDGMADDLPPPMARSLRLTKAFAGLLTGNMDLVASAFGDGRTESVEEVVDMDTELKNPTQNVTQRIADWAANALGPAFTASDDTSVVSKFKAGHTDSVAEIAGIYEDILQPQKDTTNRIENWAKDNLGPGWQLVVAAFNLGRTDSVAEVEGLNSDLETPTASTVRELDYWSNNLGTGWTGVSDEFNTGRVDSVAEVTGMNTDLQLNTGSTITGINVFTTLLGIGLKLVSGEFNTGRVDSVAEVTGMNTDLGTETGTTTTNLSTWVTDKLGPGWQRVKDAFGIGRTDVNTEMTGLNTDLKAAEKTTTDELDLWNVVLGTWWGVVKGTFNTGRTDTVAEVTGLNTDLGTEQTATNTGLDLWSGQLNTGWIDLTSEFETGADNSIDEMMRVGASVAGEERTTASSIDRWGLSMHLRFQELKNLSRGRLTPLSALSIVSGARCRVRLTLSVGCAENALSLFPVSGHRVLVAARRGQRRAP